MNSKQALAYATFLYLVGDEINRISQKLLALPVDQSESIDDVLRNRAAWRACIDEYKKLYSAISDFPVPSHLSTEHKALVSAYNDLIVAAELQYNAEDFNSPEYVAGLGKFKLAQERTVQAIKRKLEAIK
jgi:hypothetical protein